VPFSQIRPDIRNPLIAVVVIAAAIGAVVAMGRRKK